MSNIQTGAERMPHDLSHLGFLAGQIGRLITISTTPVIAGDSFEMDAVGALDRKSGSAGMPRPISYAVFCLKKKKEKETDPDRELSYRFEDFYFFLRRDLHRRGRLSN